MMLPSHEPAPSASAKDFKIQCVGQNRRRKLSTCTSVLQDGLHGHSSRFSISPIISRLFQTSLHICKKNSQNVEISVPLLWHPCSLLHTKVQGVGSSHLIAFGALSYPLFCGRVTDTLMLFMIVMLLAYMNSPQGENMDPKLLGKSLWLTTRRPGYPWISSPKIDFPRFVSKGSARINFWTPTPSCGRPLSHLTISGPTQLLSAVLIFLLESQDPEAWMTPISGKLSLSLGADSETPFKVILGDFQGIVGAPRGVQKVIVKVILGRRNLILGVASHDLRHAKITIQRFPH